MAGGKNRPLRVTPRKGGALITRASAEVASFADYVWKHDFRRDLDQEMRREGDDYFRPDLDVELGDQPYPQNLGFEVAGFENGSFEADTDGDGIPDGWARTLSGGMTGIIDPATAGAGTYSYKFLSTLAGDEGYLESDSFLPVTSGMVWRIGWSVKASSVLMLAEVRVLWYDENNNLISTDTIFSSADNSTLEFMGHFYNASPPPNSASGKIRLYGKVSADANFGSVWFDSVTLDERESAIRPITLVHNVRRPNGKMAIIVGTKTTLYRFYSFEDGDYVGLDLDTNYMQPDGVGAPYFLVADEYVTLPADPEGYILDDGPGTPYFADANGAWKIIGSGFSADGGRWEAENINGWAVFNNGRDLPVTYRVEDEEVKPLYELREAGVAFVGSIAEYAGVLMCFDIAQIKPDVMMDQFEHESSGLIKAKQYGARNSTPTTGTNGTGYGLMIGPGVLDDWTAANSASLQDWPDGISIETWIKFTPLQTRTYNVLKKGASFQLNLFGKASTGKGQVLFNANGVEIEPLSHETQVDPNVWNHIAVTYDGDFARVYLNAVLAFEQEIGGLVPASGTDPLTNKVPFIGPTITYGDMRVWSGVRSQADIAAYMTTDPPLSADLKAWWKFDEGTGGTSADSSGNVNTVTLSGATWVVSDAPCDAYVVTTGIAQNTLVRAANVSTFSSTVAHHFSTGDTVVISDAVNVTFNGTFTITKVDDYSFTYANVAANASTTGAVARISFFTAGMVGLFIAFSNGLTSRIVGFVDGTKVKVSDSVNDLVGYNLPFYLYNTSTAQLTGTVDRTIGTTGLTSVAVDTLFLTELSVGQLIRVPNGSGEEIRKITAIASNTSLTVDAVWAASGAATAAYHVSDYTVISDSEIFTASDIGRQIFFPDGLGRIIVGFQNSKRVDVDFYTAINLQTFLLENVTAYDAITDANQYDRIQYRALWSMNDRPTIFNATVRGSITKGSRQLTIEYPLKSLAVGDQITIIGAGVSNVNLTATIVFQSPSGQLITLDKAAENTVELQYLQRTESIGSIVGYSDLQDDGSAIIAAMDLRSTLVIYKDTAIFLCDYTGIAAAPFNFRRVYQGTDRGSDSLFYKNTLVNVGTFHMYIGKSGFFTFDLTSQLPQDIDMFDAVGDLTFPVLTQENTNEIFAGANACTKEIFFMFPGGIVSGICYDWKYKTLSTIGVDYTAVATVKRPVAGISVGVQEDWCVCGDASGTVILYGAANLPQVQWGGAASIFHRRGADYTCTLRSGLWGGGYFEEDFTNYVLELSTQARPVTGGCVVNFYGYRNAAEAGALLGSKTIDNPDQHNLVPCFFRQHYFQDEIVVTGVNKPFRLAARTMNGGPVFANSIPRRPNG